jgi:hypothetical protein
MVPIRAAQAARDFKTVAFDLNAEREETLIAECEPNYF